MTVEDVVAALGLTLVPSSFDRGAMIIPTFHINDLKPKLEQLGWEDNGGYTSSTGRSLGFRNKENPDLRITLSEPKGKKYFEGTFIDLKNYNF